MAKFANPGELRTEIVVLSANEKKDQDGYTDRQWEAVLELKVKWVNLHGREVWEQMAHLLREPATLTCRYTPKIDELSRVIKKSDYEKYLDLIETDNDLQAETLCYEVISLDNVDERGVWLEVRIQRVTRAK